MRPRQKSERRPPARLEPVEFPTRRNWRRLVFVRRYGQAHFKTLFAKLEVPVRPEAAISAIRQGIVPLD